MQTSLDMAYVNSLTIEHRTSNIERSEKEDGEGQRVRERERDGAWSTLLTSGSKCLLDPNLQTKVLTEKMKDRERKNVFIARAIKRP